MTKRALRAACAVAGIVCAFVVPATAAHSLWSTSATATFTVTVPAAPVPAPPASLSCAGFQNKNRVTLTWTRVPGATEYRLYERRGSVAPYTFSEVLATVADPTATADLNSHNPLLGNHDRPTVVVRAYKTPNESTDSNARVIDFAKESCT